jgi:alpha 1,2-mannosyltransferase
MAWSRVVDLDLCVDCTLSSHRHHSSFSSSQPGTDQQIPTHLHYHNNNSTRQQQLEISTKDYINEQFSVDQLLSTWPSHRPKAAFTILCRNSDLSAILKSIKDLEARFNSQNGYPYIFLNYKPFTKRFKDTIRAETTARSFFGLIPSDHWRLPDSISVAQVVQGMEKMIDSILPCDDPILYVNSLSYRHMCRYFSGFFMLHPLLQGFDYYWRVEPDINFYCDIQPDPFKEMAEGNYKYGFNIMVPEDIRTIPSLWLTVKLFTKKFPQHVDAHNALAGLLPAGTTGNYNDQGCHFWSNFEIGDLSWLRSREYQDHFRYLDQTNMFFLERWGDAPVHSLAATILLPADAIHFFQNIGYLHDWYKHCPSPYSKHFNNCECSYREDINVYDPTARQCLLQFLNVQDKHKLGEYCQNSPAECRLILDADDDKEEDGKNEKNGE